MSTSYTEAPFDAMKYANAMSCDAMSGMAQNEVLKNFNIRLFAASSPVCNRYQELADRELELKMLAGNGLARSMCFNPCQHIQVGEWEKQFNVDLHGGSHKATASAVVPATFIANTRPR